ncbi:unnamed protein product [Prunus armeniaca]|uniref:Uncharacterized protein n=1 Tax=Prunus armeniaca TaxID=36596 RepID=A0A6J5USA0_PRUAR|nr:unnamed protein product [Prunus armeniaca]
MRAPLACRELELLISDLYNWGPNGILHNLHDLDVVDEESSCGNQAGNTPICMSEDNANEISDARD